MTMRDAFLDLCYVPGEPPEPSPFNPITNEKPPYGDGPTESNDLKVGDLIVQLLKHGSLSTPLDTPIEHIDVWGEGRKCDAADGKCLVSGFPKSFNINLNQGIGPQGYVNFGRAIPNLLPVCYYTDLFNMIPDKSVTYLTIMGAPLIVGIAREMARIVTDEGAIVTFGFKHTSTEIKILKRALSSFSRNFTLSDDSHYGPDYYAIFSSDPAFQPVLAFTKNGDKQYIHDEL